MDSLWSVYLLVVIHPHRIDGWGILTTLDKIKQKQSEVQQQIEDLQQELDELLADQKEMAQLIEKGQKLRRKYR